MQLKEYDTQERLAPATLTLTVNGKEVAKTRIERSVPSLHSFGETFDVGIDAGTPVSNKYSVKNHFPYTGELDKVVFKLTE